MCFRVLDVQTWGRDERERVRERQTERESLREIDRQRRKTKEGGRGEEITRERLTARDRQSHRGEREWERE